MRQQSPRKWDKIILSQSAEKKLPQYYPICTSNYITKIALEDLLVQIRECNELSKSHLMTVVTCGLAKACHD